MNRGLVTIIIESLSSKTTVCMRCVFLTECVPYIFKLKKGNVARIIYTHRHAAWKNAMEFLADSFYKNVPFVIDTTPESSSNHISPRL